MFSSDLVTRLVSAKSLSCVCPLHALPNVAFPPVGRLGLTSPRSTVLCDATTPPVLLGVLRLSLVPRYLACFPRSWSPRRARGLVEASSPRQGLWSPGPPLRACVQGHRWLSQVPEFPSEDMPRSQTPVVSCALAKAHPGLLPSSHWKPSATHNATHFGAQSRGLSPRYTRLRTAPYGEARGVATTCWLARSGRLGGARLWGRDRFHGAASPPQLASCGATSAWFGAASWHGRRDSLLLLTGSRTGN